MGEGGGSICQVLGLYKLADGIFRFLSTCMR